MKTNKRKGFTLIESLVMLIILAVGMAVSVPIFVSAIADGKKKQCRSNMQAIADAEQQYKIKSSSHVYTTVLSNLVGDFPVVPVCPNGGTYTVTISDGTATAQSGQNVPLGKLVISCSLTADGKFAQTIDSQ